jgi:hypothetical protein
MNTQRGYGARAACASGRLAVWIAVLAALLAGAAALAHDADPERPTAADLALARPALSGSEAFARELLAHAGGWVTEPSAASLDRVAARLAAADALRSGRAPGGAAEADYQRWRGEQALLAFAAAAPGLVRLDVRQAQQTALGAPIAMGQEGLLLVAAELPGEGTSFVVQEMDLTGERDPGPCTIEVGREGVTYMLLKLSQLPTGESTLVLSLRRRGDERPSLFGSVRLVSAPLGQLAVDVRDEHGESTPALLRLTSVRGRRLLEPAGALDFSPMLNQVTGLPIYGPGRGYPVWLPLRWQGRYWVVPGRFEMAVPAGVWEVDIIRGPEFEPVHALVEVPPQGRVQRVIRLQRWTSLARQGWFSGDDHVHSRLMHSEDADKLMAFVRATDLNLCNVLEMGDSSRTWYAQRGFGPDFRVQYGDHWLVPGQEDPRSALGHAIGLNLQSKVRDPARYLLNDWVADEIHKQGGLYGHTHVGSGVKELLTEREMALFTPMGIVDFNSVMQAGLGTALFYDFLNLGFRMTATAGSDTPYGGTVGAVRTYAYCGKRRFTPDAWFEAVRAGRTFVSNGVMVGLEVNGQLPGAEIAVGPGDTLRLRARAFGLPGQWAPRRLEIVWLGEVVRRVEAGDSPERDLKLKADLPAGCGGWLVAHAVGEDGSEALTSPVYVVRPGFRGWNTAQAEAILSRQLQVLDEIDTALTEAAEIAARPERALDLYNRLLADQAAAVRTRLARSRAVYLGLRETLATEAARRAAER